jgi:hypothetical protein
LENTGGTGAPVKNNLVTQKPTVVVDDTLKPTIVVDVDMDLNNDDEDGPIDKTNMGADNFVNKPIPIEANEPSLSTRDKIMILVVFVSLLLCCACFCVSRANRQKEIATERAHVFSYLQAFDVEDVDLRHSATGGWHGTYVNRLAHGLNRGDIDDAKSASASTVTSFSFESAPLTHSSIVKDSLFMDIDTKPSLGGNGGGSGNGTDSLGSDDDDENNDDGMGSQGRGYDGLVSAYSDLQPRSYNDRKSSLESKSKHKPWGREIV